MSRRDDWLERLIALTESIGSQPITLGVFDCALFAARGVDLQTGTTWESELRALYDDPRSAARFLAAEGGLRAAVTRRLGESRPWWKAHRGDVCLLPGEDEREVLGLCMGETIAALTPVGVRFVPLDAAITTWKVG